MIYLIAAVYNAIEKKLGGGPSEAVARERELISRKCLEIKSKECSMESDSDMYMLSKDAIGKVGQGL